MAQGAPGEEPAVFARNAGVVASKVSYVEVLDKDNDWKTFEEMDDNTSATTCEFNWCGTHLLMGDNNGRLHLWSFVPLKVKIKTLSMPPRIPLSTKVEVAGEFGSVLEAGVSWNNGGKGLAIKNGKGGEAKPRGVGHQGGGCSGWTTVCVNWSKCSKYVIAAYGQKRKALSDGREPPLPGLVVLWDILDGVIEGCIRLPSRAGHVSICPADPRRCTLCCTDGTSYLLDFSARLFSDLKARPSAFVGASVDPQLPTVQDIMRCGALSTGTLAAKLSGAWSEQTALDGTVKKSTDVDVDLGSGDTHELDDVGAGRCAKESTWVASNALAADDSVQQSRFWRQDTGPSNNGGSNGTRVSAHDGLQMKGLLPVTLERMRPEVLVSPGVCFANESISSEGAAGVGVEGAHEANERDDADTDGEGANAPSLQSSEPMVMVPVDGSHRKLSENVTGRRTAQDKDGRVSRVGLLSGSGDIVKSNADISGCTKEGNTGTVCEKSKSSGFHHPPGRESRPNTLCSMSHVTFKATAGPKGQLSTATAPCVGAGSRGVKIRSLWNPAHPFGQFNSVNDEKSANLPPAEVSALCSFSTNDSVANGVLPVGKVAGRIGAFSRQDQRDVSTDRSGMGTSGGSEKDLGIRSSGICGASLGADSAAVPTSSSRSASPVPSQSSAGGTKARLPVQVGRATWTVDGTILFLLNHEGHLLKLRVLEDGGLSLLAKAELLGGASPATLQLTPEDDWILVATAMKGLCLIPADDLDVDRGVMYGETFGIRGSKTRFWGSATIGDIHSRGKLENPGENLTIIGNPAKTRDERTDLFFFDQRGGQPERLCVPRREGVVCVSTSRLRPIVAFVCPTGMLYYREQILKTDFPGPWYPSGYILIDNNVEYQEAEDELDTVVTRTSNGEITSQTQKHEVVVPWQHEVVLVEADASRADGAQAIVIDTEGAHEPVWPRALPANVRWIPLEDKLKTSKSPGEEGNSVSLGPPRCGSQDGFFGPVSRKLSATSSLLTEARRKRGRGSKEGVDWQAKRRGFVSGFYRTLAEKEKRLAEEAAKKRRRAGEARQRKQAAKEAAARAARAAAGREVAERNARDEAERREREDAEIMVNSEPHVRQVEVKARNNAKAHDRMGLRPVVDPETREIFGTGRAGDPIHYQPFIDEYGSTLIGIGLDVQSHPSQTCSSPASSSPMGSLGVANGNGSKVLSLLPPSTSRSPETLPAPGMQSTHEVMQSHQHHKGDRGDAGGIHVARVPYHITRVPGATNTPCILPATHSGGTWANPCQFVHSRVDEGRVLDAGRTELTASNDTGASLEGAVLTGGMAIGRPSLSNKSVVGNRGTKSARRGRCVSAPEATGVSFSVSSSGRSTAAPLTSTGSRSCISSGTPTNQVAPSNGGNPSRGGETPSPGGGNTNDKLERPRIQLAADNRFAAGSRISATRDKHQLTHIQKNTNIRSPPGRSWGTVETEAATSPTCSTGGACSSQDVLGDIAFSIASGPSDAIFLASSAGSSNEHGWLDNPGTVGGVRSSPADGTFSGAGVSSAVGLGSPPTMMSGNSCLEQRGTMRNVIGVPGGGSGTAVHSYSMDSAPCSSMKVGDQPGNHLEVTSVGRTSSTGGVGSQSLQCWTWAADGGASVSSGEAADLASGYGGNIKSTSSPAGSGLRSGYTMLSPSSSQRGSQSLSPSAKDKFQPLLSFAPLQQSNVMAGVPTLPLPSGVFQGVNMLTEATTEEGGASVQEFMSAQHITTASAAVRSSQRPEEDSRWGSARDTSTSNYRSNASSGSLGLGDYDNESPV